MTFKVSLFRWDFSYICASFDKISTKGASSDPSAIAELFVVKTKANRIVQCNSVAWKNSFHDTTGNAGTWLKCSLCCEPCAFLPVSDFRFRDFFRGFFSRCFIAAFSVDLSYELRPYSVVSDLYFSEQSPDGVVAGHSRHRL